MTGLSRWILGEFHDLFVTIGVVVTCNMAVQNLGLAPWSTFWTFYVSRQGWVNKYKILLPCNSQLLLFCPLPLPNKCISWQAAESFLRKIGRGSQKEPHAFNVNLKACISKAFMYIPIYPHSWCYDSSQSWVSAGKDFRWCWAGQLSRHFAGTLRRGLVLWLVLLPEHLGESLMTLEEIKR